MRHEVRLTPVIISLLQIGCFSGVGPGTGRYPSHDPWNRPFSKDYCKSRWVLSGQWIADGYTSVLEGIQGDQDFIRILFSPSRPRRQYWCPFFAVFCFGDLFMVTPKTSAFFLHGIIFANISGFYSKQFCCYYCRACQWVYVEDDEGFCQFLYTNFGPQASHRNTRPSCLELFLLRDTPQNNQHIHILSWCFFIRDICAISCLKLFLWRTPPRTLSYFGICFLHDWARQSRLVTKQEWLDINGKCPLTDIPGWSPWRTPAKKIFFSFGILTKKFRQGFGFPELFQCHPISQPRNFPGCHAYHPLGIGARCDHIVPTGLVGWFFLFCWGFTGPPTEWNVAKLPFLVWVPKLSHGWKGPKKVVYQ